MTLNFDLLMVIGLCMVPGSVLVFILCMLVFAREEIGAMAIASVAAIVVLVAGIAVFLVGLGQELH